ncbi:unnamed protein product [Heterobilharzia americana]|nr:unnamed protein product [Heterobilharzia americana]
MREVQTEEELQQAIKESETRLMILDFFADWCGPCKRVAPELDKICEECEDVLFIKLNVDELEIKKTWFSLNSPRLCLIK